MYDPSEIREEQSILSLDRSNTQSGATLAELVRTDLYGRPKSQDGVVFRSRYNRKNYSTQRYYAMQEWCDKQIRARSEQGLGWRRIQQSLKEQYNLLLSRGLIERVVEQGDEMGDTFIQISVGRPKIIEYNDVIKDYRKLGYGARKIQTELTKRRISISYPTITRRLIEIDKELKAEGYTVEKI